MSHLPRLALICLNVLPSHSVCQASFLHNKPKQQTKSILNYPVSARIPGRKVRSQDLCLLHHTGRLDQEQGGTFNRSNRELWGSFPRVKVGKISCNFLKIKVRILTGGKRSSSLTQLEAAFSSLVLLKQSHTPCMKHSNQGQNLLPVQLLSASSKSISGPSLVTK